MHLTLCLGDMTSHIVGQEGNILIIKNFPPCFIWQNLQSCGCDLIHGSFLSFVQFLLYVHYMWSQVTTDTWEQHTEYHLQ